MAFTDAFLPEFDLEMKTTRKCLDRVPEDKFGWKPHPKSYTLGQLASHIANIANYGTNTIKTESLDVAPPDGPAHKQPTYSTKPSLLEGFDKNVSEARAAIAGANDEDLRKNWTLLAGGKTIFSLPRAAVLRTFMMSHLIHHRAQLGVYLRLNDLPVPSVYGPSADEQGF